ncbi:MAG: DNA primase [Caldimicrobium sp.]|nr:DNA primase [Caldimicrobium sp.]MDW8183328.1 DNA primase [Caldimicrobium sp.]
MPMSTPDLFGEVKSCYDIVNFVSQYVKLKRVGRNYVGLCPFHHEKTPSFTVSSEKQIFKCFGCGASGDVVSFYMKLKGLDFKNALYELAEKAGIKIEKSSFIEKRKERELLELNFKVTKLYQSFLWNHASGKRALEYLRNRGLSEETLQKFYLGYAPPEGRVIAGLLRASKVDLGLAVEAGILRKSEDGSFVDLFRDRIVFPIFNESGECVAFGGRALSAEVEPKYLNSPETRIFKKGEILYGLFQSKDFIKKEKSTFIVEGYFDYLTLWDKGIRNVVATCGTALTEKHLQRLMPMAEEYYLLFDSDQAGKKATLRAIQVFVKENLLPKVVVLPEGEDPDSFVRSLKREASFDLRGDLLNLTKNAISFCYYLFKEENPSSPSKVFDNLLEIFGGAENPFVLQDICRELSYIFGVSESEIKRCLKGATSLTLRDRETCQGDEDPQGCFLRMIAQYLTHFPEDLELFDEIGLREFIDEDPERPYSRFLSCILEIKPKSDLELLKVPDPWFQEFLSDLLFSPPFEDREEVREQISRFLTLERKKRKLKRIAESLRYYEKAGKKEEVEIFLYKIKGALTFEENSKI